MKTPDDEDPEIGRRFRELREQEQTGAPGFRQVLARIPSSTGSSRLRIFAAGAALLAACLLAAILLPRREPAAPDPTRTSTLSQWKASTDVLLATPGSALLESSPALPEPVPDYSSLAGIPAPREAQPTRSPKRSLT